MATGLHRRIVRKATKLLRSAAGTRRRTETATQRVARLDAEFIKRRTFWDSKSPRPAPLTQDEITAGIALAQVYKQRVERITGIIEKHVDRKACSVMGIVGNSSEGSVANYRFTRPGQHRHAMYMQNDAPPTSVHVAFYLWKLPEIRAQLVPYFDGQKDLSMIGTTAAALDDGANRVIEEAQKVAASLRAAADALRRESEAHPGRWRPLPCRTEFIDGTKGSVNSLRVAGA